MDNEMKMVGFSTHKGFFNTYINVATSTQKLLNYLSNEYESKVKGPRVPSGCLDFRGDIIK